MKTDNTSLEEQINLLLISLVYGNDEVSEYDTREGVLKAIVALIQHSIDTETKKARINELSYMHIGKGDWLYTDITGESQGYLDRIKQLEEKE